MTWLLAACVGPIASDSGGRLVDSEPVIGVTSISGESWYAYANGADAAGEYECEVVWLISTESSIDQWSGLEQYGSCAACDWAFVLLFAVDWDRTRAPSGSRCASRAHDYVGPHGFDVQDGYVYTPQSPPDSWERYMPNGCDPEHRVHAARRC